MISLKGTDKDYLSPVTKYLDLSNDTIKEDIASHIIIMLNIDPKKRNIVGLCSFLDIEVSKDFLVVPEKHTLDAIIERTINRYKDKIKNDKTGNNIVETPKTIIKWMCRKLKNPKALKPSNIPLYKLLLAERKILRVLNYYIV